MAGRAWRSRMLGLFVRSDCFVVGGRGGICNQLKAQSAFRTRHADPARGDHRVPRGRRAAHCRACAVQTGLSADRAVFRRCASRKLKVPVYVVYGTVAVVCGLWLAYGALL